MCARQSSEEEVHAGTSARARATRASRSTWEMWEGRKAGTREVWLVLLELWLREEEMRLRWERKFR